MTTVPSGCTEMAMTWPCTPEAESKGRATSPGAASELLLSAAMRSRRLMARKCVADHFDFFIHLTFPLPTLLRGAHRDLRSHFAFSGITQREGQKIFREPRLFHA